MSIELGSEASRPAARAAGETSIVAPGFMAGVFGGIAMAVWMALSAAVAGADPLSPLTAMGQTFAGATPRADGAVTVLAGLALHLLFSGAVGVVFAALLPGDLEPRFASFMSMGYTWVVMGVMTSSVLPAVNPALRDEMPALGGAWVLAHTAYGLTVGFAVQRLRQRKPRLRERPARREPSESHA